MRIAIDVDSTLHHYWDVLSEISARRFGIELPYEEQFTWGITRLRPEQLSVCIDESHTDERIIAGQLYPGAAETVRAWHERGHFIHITSHRASECALATATWLQRLEVPFDDLCCSYDKVARCVELDIDLLIDDCPLNIAAAVERGIVAATIVHPWNRELCEEEHIPCAESWQQLRALLDPLLSADGEPVPAGRVGRQRD